MFGDTDFDSRVNQVDTFAAPEAIAHGAPPFCWTTERTAADLIFAQQKSLRKQ